MTVTEHLAPTATMPVVRALLDDASAKGYHSGVLGIRARPGWDGLGHFEHGGVPVTVAACPSVLAVSEALLGRAGGRWLVVLTDRDDADLGAGVLAHLVGHRLRTPDPWSAVRHRFQATGIDPALTTSPSPRDLATGLLAACPPEGWPPAASGVLTRGHALAAVARQHLGLETRQGETDASAVLRWTADPGTPARIADLRGLAGNALTETTLGWAAEATGAAAEPVRTLLTGGALADVLPLGLVLDLLLPRDGAGADEEQVRGGALIRVESLLGGRPPTQPALRAWAVEARGAATGLLLAHPRKDGERLLARADALLEQLRAGPLAELSDLLSSGLTSRLGRLAAALHAAALTASSGTGWSGAGPAGVGRTGVGPAGGGLADAPQLAVAGLGPVEQTWRAVLQHERSLLDPRVGASQAAVRLLRWLAVPSGPPGSGLAALVERHRGTDAWVDAAVSDAAAGVGAPDLGSALAEVLDVVRRRRAPHDAAFAAALADAVRADDRAVPVLEDLLARTVLPLAGRTPVLLLVLDGMSVAVAIEVMAGIADEPGEGWVEVLPAGEQRRAVALAALPTLTEHSRAALLCGRLTSGGQDRERAGYQALTTAHGLRAQLFHKKALDGSRPGQAVANVVAAALDDIEGTRLVTCVLNAIDDALDRSDPDGTHWDLGAVKHLRPLLERARVAGRSVVLTADHGHVIERRQGRQRPDPGMTSGRSRGALPPAGDGEVLVTGRRVVGGSAVLAVDETLRYGPLKAGYHGGASPAEVVVPVCVVAPGVPPDGWEPAPPQEPLWWWTTPHLAAPPRSAPPAAPCAPTLFDDVEDAPAATPVATPSTGGLLARAVVASPTYRQQRRAAGRVTVRDEQVVGLLTALLEADDSRLAPQPAAQALAEAPTRVRGAVAQVQRLLNVEGYAVLSRDLDEMTLVLDPGLLREQFEVG